MPPISGTDDTDTHDPTVGTPAGRRARSVLATVEQAIRRRNVALALQPVVRASAPAEAAFFEGLVRVLDPSGNPIPAGAFIPDVEANETGRIIDCLALELGLNALESDPELTLSINMSSRSIGYGRWTQVLRRGIARNGGLGGRLILEITEASTMAMPDVVRDFMSGLRKSGILFALDDFGAGYTAFRHLKTFRFDILKIDGQFVRGIHADRDNQVLLGALAGIGRQFDMLTVAESVEQAEEADFLESAGIDCLQGYHFGAPQLRVTALA